MSVYTSVSKSRLEAFLSHYDVGELLDFSGIEAGVENTNYFVSTNRGEFVLTIYEDLSANELPFFLGLMRHLSEYQVPTVTPVARASSAESHEHSLFITTLCDKPAALVHRLPGSSVEVASPEHCAVVANAIAQVHLAGLSYRKDSEYRTGSCRDDNRARELEKLDCDDVFSRLTTTQAQLLRHELDHYVQFDWSALPHGIVHSDLFRDNCLFYDDLTTGEPVKLSGIIDFYYASHDALLYDLAVIANDWCCNAQGQLDAQRHLTLLRAYDAVRPLSDYEKQQWPALLRISALHFWGFRLLFNLYPRQGESVAVKNAEEFQDKIEWQIRHQTQIDAIIKQL